MGSILLKVPHTQFDGPIQIAITEFFKTQLKRVPIRIEVIIDVFRPVDDGPVRYSAYL